MVSNILLCIVVKCTMSYKLKVIVYYRLNFNCFILDKMGNAPLVVRKRRKNFVGYAIDQRTSYQNEIDFEELSRITGITINEIQKLHSKFKLFTSDDELNYTQFFRLFTSLRDEPPAKLTKISNYIYHAFDANNNGTINFEEFAVKKAFVLKLRFLFSI